MSDPAYLARSGSGKACACHLRNLGLLVAGALGMLVRAGAGWRTGRWLTVTVRDGWLLRVVAVVAVLALWANQQQHAALLVAR